MFSTAELFSFIALSHLLFLICLFWYERGNEKNAGVPLFFGLTIAGYVVMDTAIIQNNPALHYSLMVLPILAPIAFWLFSKWVFDDHFHWKNGWLGLFVVVAAFYYFIFFQNKSHFFDPSQTLKILLGMATQILSLTFILLGILEAVRSRDGDLVESRLQFRNIFIWTTAVLMAMTALVEISLAGAAPPMSLAVLQKMGITVLVLYFTANRLLLKRQILPENDEIGLPQFPSETFKVAEFDSNLLENLRNLMEKQQIWRNEGLTIRALAEKMDVKEYRLRQAINQHLGYRNFNDYLNGFRIREACTLLIAQRELTVLEIAYQVGFASLAPFNKAFRDQTGMAPTEWRRQAS